MAKNDIDYKKTEQNIFQNFKINQQCDYIRIDIADTGPGITQVYISY